MEKETHRCPISRWGLSLLNSQQWEGLCLPWSYCSPLEGSRVGLCIPSLEQFDSPNQAGAHSPFHLPGCPRGCVVPGSLCLLPAQALGLIDIDKYFQSKSWSWMSPAGLLLCFPGGSSAGAVAVAVELCCRAILHDRSWAIYRPAQMLCQRAGAQGTVRINPRLSESGAQLSGYQVGFGLSYSAEPEPLSL